MAGAPLSAGDLRNAIERREVIPYFQPIVELRSGRLWGFEMLGRWQHAEQGLISPGRFIPLAESSGLMDPLSDLLAEQAFEFLGARFPRHLTLSINVTPAQMRDRSLPARIGAAAKRAGFPAGQLIVEITETALLSDLKAAVAIANDFKAQGIKLALDDFGTGYSSLGYLNSLPLDEIKIDQSFVRAMNDQKESRKIAAAVAGLGQSLGLTTVAEGIEEKTHSDMLFYLGCELGQGYLYSRPVPTREVPGLIERDSLSSPPTSPLLAKEMAAQLEVAPALRLAQLQAIYDSAPVGLCFLDRDLRYVSINKQFTDLAPNSPLPRLGRTVEEVVEPVTYARVRSYLQRALAGQASYNVEVPLSSSEDGSPPKTVLMFCHPVFDEANEVVGVSVAIRDITSQKHIEQDLLHHKDHYRIPLELSSNYPFTADPQGNISWFETRGLTGAGMDELLGQGWQKIVHPDDLPALDEKWASDLRTGTQHEHKFRIRMADGTWRWTRSRAAPRRDEDGKIVGWYGLLEEISDHK